MTSTQQNGPKSMTADGGWTSISSCLVQGEKEELMRGRSSSDVSPQFDLLSGSRFGIATLGKRYPLQSPPG